MLAVLLHTGVVDDPGDEAEPRHDPLGASPDQQRRIPARVDQKLLHRPVTPAVLAEAKQRRPQALAAPLLDQPTHVQERVLAPAGIPANKVLLVGA
jgi:hypothetical protein